LALSAVWALPPPAGAARRDGALWAPGSAASGIETSSPARPDGQPDSRGTPADAIETAAREDAERSASAEPPQVPPTPGGEGAAPPSDADAELAGIDDSFLDEDLGPDPAERDHLPRWNRLVFALNESVIRWVMRPISRGYQAIAPKLVREMVARAFENLEGPVIFANDLLQLDPCRAGLALGRFAINSIAGVGGLIDVAVEMGIPRHDTDFGETLGRWGAGSGSYVMLPVLGPSTARDTLGEIVDRGLRPEAWLLGAFPQLVLTGGGGLASYDIQAERLEALRATSIDFYAALRSAYLMDRDAQIEALRGAGRCGVGRKSATP
jgi:phospholipid-binding lipoprotein MlaA